MRDTDLPEFSALLDAVCSLLSRGAYVPSATNTALFFRAMARWPLADVRAAFDAHVADPQRGRFVPVPADLIAQLEARAGDDGRPGEEEAWSIALAGRDEAASIVWTAEIAEAWGVARNILPDKIGARMAFKEAYAKAVAGARSARRPMRWELSEGSDPALRVEALKVAAGQGRIPRGQVSLAEALPAPRSPVLLLAGGSATSAPSPAQRAALAALSAALAARTEAPSADAVDRRNTAALRADADAKAKAYAKSIGESAA